MCVSLVRLSYDQNCLLLDVRNQSSLDGEMNVCCGPPWHHNLRQDQSFLDDTVVTLAHPPCITPCPPCITSSLERSSVPLSLCFCLFTFDRACNKNDGEMQCQIAGRCHRRRVILGEGNSQSPWPHCHPPRLRRGRRVESRLGPARAFFRHTWPDSFDAMGRRRHRSRVLAEVLTVGGLPWTSRGLRGVVACPTIYFNIDLTTNTQTRLQSPSSSLASWITTKEKREQKFIPFFPLFHINTVSTSWYYFSARLHLPPITSFFRFHWYKRQGCYWIIEHFQICQHVYLRRNHQVPELWDLFFFLWGVEQFALAQSFSKVRLQEFTLVWDPSP